MGVADKVALAHLCGGCSSLKTVVLNLFRSKVDFIFVLYFGILRIHISFNLAADLVLTGCETNRDSSSQNLSAVLESSISFLWPQDVYKCAAFIKNSTA